MQRSDPSLSSPQPPQPASEDLPGNKHESKGLLPGILICDENLRPIFANPTIREWVGMPLESLEAPALTQLHAQLQKQWRDRKPEQIVFDRQTQIAMGGAGYVDLLPFDLHGKEYVAMVVQPGAPQDAVQREFAQALTQTALSQLAGGLIHEINNPTTSILINARLLQIKNLSADEAEESTLAIAEQAERIASLTRILHFSAAEESAELQRLPVNHLLSMILKLHLTRFDREHIRTETAFDGAEPEVLCRKDQIIVALLQLIHNARLALNAQYAGEADKKLLHASTGIFANEGKAFVQVIIADNGIGLEPEIAALVFTPFFSAWPHQQRAGMGLFVARTIARAHGGDLVLLEESKLRTAFALRLPVER